MGYRQQCTTILVMLLLSVTTIAVAKEEQEAVGVLKDVERWVDTFLQGDLAADDFLAPITSRIDRAHEERGDLKFYFSDPLFNWGYVSFKTEKYPEIAESFKVSINPKARLQKADVELIWGKSREGIMGPSDPYPSLWFQPIDKPEFKYIGRLIVYVENNLEHATSYVVEIRVTRKSRDL